MEILDARMLKRLRRVAPSHRIPLNRARLNVSEVNFVRIACPMRTRLDQPRKSSLAIIRFWKMLLDRSLSNRRLPRLGAMPRNSCRRHTSRPSAR